MISKDSLWAQHAEAWREPLDVVSLAENISQIDSKLFEYKITGRWWQTLAELGITLLVSREYEHFLLAFHAASPSPRISYFPLPHPSGLAWHPQKETLFIASTRNPNQIFAFRPLAGVIDRLDVRTADAASFFAAQPLLPARSFFLPGSTYLHDLALINGQLHANAVGHNAIVRIDDDGRFERVWWPKCIETEAGPLFGQNYLQLNSIAAGEGLESSYFSASTDRISRRRPGHKNFKVDRQGVLFSGETRQPIIRGLTRPHSARLHNGRVWVANSGYGELGFADQGRWQPVVRLPGWTRGLHFVGRYAFVGTSRVLPRFRQYAPGVDLDSSVCGIHIVDLVTAKVIGSIIWPFGNQIFAFEAIPATITTGFATETHRRRAVEREKKLYYSYNIQGDLD